MLPKDAPDGSIEEGDDLALMLWIVVYRMCSTRMEGGMFNMRIS
jgi:hypothetical protein